MSDLVFTSAVELAQMIRDRTVSSVEVLDAYLSQIAKHNAKLNAIAESTHCFSVEMALLNSRMIPMNACDRLATALFQSNIRSNKSATRPRLKFFI